jgi:hypothetical protein
LGERKVPANEVCPLRRFELWCRSCSTRRQAGTPSHGVALPFRVFISARLAPTLVRCSPRALVPRRGELQGLRSAETSGEAVRIPEIPLVGLGSPSEFHKHQAAPATGLRQRIGSLPPLRFRSPTAFPRARLRYRGAGFASPDTPGAFRFSQPLDAFARCAPAGHVSDQIRSWGSPFRALLLSRSRTPSPAPLPSWRHDYCTGCHKTAARQAKPCGP